MSYVDPHRSGTTFGVVEFNDIFAPNTSIDWGTIASDLDTVICKVPFNDANGDPLNAYHLLTAYKDATGNLHWYGPGVYMCFNADGSSDMQMGDAVCVANSTPSAINSRPNIEFPSTTTDREYPFGIVLEPIAQGGIGSVAMAGVWPAKRGSNTLAFQDHVLVDNSPVGCVFTASTDQTGAMGRTIALDYPIITDALGTTTNGGVILMWGTSRELY